MRFSPLQRLGKQREFLSVRNDGQKFHCGNFILQVLVKEENGDPLRRIGIIASRKTGNSVKRSRAKRVFREIFRNNQNSLPSICDLVIVAFHSFDQASYQDLEQRFLKVCKQLNNG
tara:strand:+ start:316 stop:663 length:348 start_codon:yes stop_codon:yes gene_type:complete